MSNLTPLTEAANKLDQTEKVELIKSVFETLTYEGQSLIAAFAARNNQQNIDQSNLANRVYTIGQAAKLLAVSSRSITSWFDSGKLRGYRIEGARVIRIPHEQLASFLIKKDQAKRVPKIDGDNKKIAYTSGQAAKIAGVSSKTIKRWVLTRKLKGYYVSGNQDRRIRHEDLMAFAVKQGRQTAPAA